MTRSSLMRFRRIAAAASAVSVMLLAAPAAEATAICSYRLKNGLFCVSDNVHRNKPVWHASYLKRAGGPISGYMQLETEPVDRIYGNKKFSVRAGAAAVEIWDQPWARPSPKNRCGRAWMVVPAQRLTTATPWTCRA